MAGAPARVCAALVTYNRRELLVECLDALLAQTHPVERVLVVDNASSDGTTELLRERGLLDDTRIAYERLGSNRGGAGGFARAIALARADCDWIWVMDDDAEPPPDALERLLSAAPAADAGTAALAQAVVSPDGSVQLGARGHLGRRPVPLALDAYSAGGYAELDYATFVGLLIRGSAARSIDPPRADFFIWGDDYEYCLRLRLHGAVRLVPESRIVHKDVGHVAYANRRSRLWNRLFGWSFGATPYEGFWRNICGIRNFVWLKKAHHGQSALGAVGTVAEFVVKALLYDERPLRRVPWIVRAGIDGRLGVFQTIGPQEWVARVRRGEW